MAMTPARPKLVIIPSATGQPHHKERYLATAPTDLSNLDRYVLITSDSHAGPEPHMYGPYLPTKWQDDFAIWLRESEETAKMMRKIMGPRSIGVDGDPEIDGGRNWDSARRLAEMQDDGVVGEVIFSNTSPPFSPRIFSEFGEPSLGDDPARRWAGIQAHNRWLADFCAEAPKQRAGLVQIFLPNIEASVEEIRWAKEAGLWGGVLLPGAPPGSGTPPLYAPEYEPIWDVCEELDMTVSHHAGSATPDYGMYIPQSMAMFMLEVKWWTYRSLWHLIFSGVFERHPNLQFSITEAGAAWAPDVLRELDAFYNQMKFEDHTSERIFGGPTVEKLSLTPREYFERQIHLGASFFPPRECAMRHEIGVDRIMWGTDYPHTEGSYPYTRELLRLTFDGVPEDEIQQMCATNAAAVYGFDLDHLAGIAAKVGPTKAEIAEPIDYASLPERARKCPGFSPDNQRAA
jgi:predicted TIM-barrel fold metal-dependent hydrolase